MHPTEHPQEGSQVRPASFTSITMHLPHAVPVVITRLLPVPVVIPPVAHRAVPYAQTAHAPVPAPRVRIQHMRSWRDRTPHDGQARRRVGALPHEVAHLAAATGDQREDRGAVCLISAVPPPLVGPPPGWICRV